MALFSFFKTPNPKRFDYKPRFYDADKEALTERRRLYEQAKEGNGDAIKSRISSVYNRRRVPTSRQTSRNSNIILVGVLAALFLVSYLVLRVYLPIIIEHFF